MRVRAAPRGLRGFVAENVVDEDEGVDTFFAVVGVELPECESPRLLPGREFCGVDLRDFDVTSLTRDVVLLGDFLSLVRREKTLLLGLFVVLVFSGVGGSAARSLTYFDDVVRAGVSGVSS